MDEFSEMHGDEMFYHNR